MTKDELLRERLKGILSGKIPNRLSLKEIKEGVKELGGDMDRVNLDEWVTNLSVFSLGKNRLHFWLTVLLFLPLKEIPTLINYEDTSAQGAARYRLLVGK